MNARQRRKWSRANGIPWRVDQAPPAWLYAFKAWAARVLAGAQQ